jgi:hypothetical protein
MIIDPKFVRDLGRALNLRHIAEGIGMLNKAETLLKNLPAAHPQSTEVLLLVAQWVDVGYQNQQLLDSLLEKFPAGAHGGGISGSVGGRGGSRH